MPIDNIDDLRLNKITFRLDISTEQLKIMSYSYEYFDSIKITMLEDIYFKGVLRTLKFDKQMIETDKCIRIDYVLTIDKEDA